MNALVALLAVSSGLLLALFLGFRLLEWTKPRERRAPLLRPALATDIAYWFFQTLIVRHVTRLVVVIAIVPLALAIYGRVDRTDIMNGFGPVAALPLWLQAVLILVGSDFIGYWMHRGFHGRRLWSFHAIHHSPRHLDWLSAVRQHPVNDAVMKVATTLPLLAIGFAPKAVAGVLPVLLLFALLLHADLDWDWGPLRGVVASPRFHRWHHTSEAEARDKNFAGLFPIWDIAFGTYYMPKDRVSTRFGTDTPLPESLLGQLAFPFRRVERAAAPGARQPVSTGVPASSWPHSVQEPS